MPQFGRASVVAAIEAMKMGKLIVVTDDEDRENEGDFIMAAQFATPETVAKIVRHGSGVICVSVSVAGHSFSASALAELTRLPWYAQVKDKRLQELELPPMVVNNEDPKQTAFTVSVDVKVRIAAAPTLPTCRQRHNLRTGFRHRRARRRVSLPPTAPPRSAPSRTPAASIRLQPTWPRLPAAAARGGAP